jgi:hypothetical protein
MFNVAKCGLGYTLGDFFTKKAIGHPACHAVSAELNCSDYTEEYLRKILI